MFGDRRCSSCGEKVKKGWIFCPFCGEELEIKKGEVRTFKSIFDDVDEELRRIDKTFGLDFFKFPRFRTRPRVKGGGISIIVRSGTGTGPRIEVRTSGEYKKLESGLKTRLGVKPAAREVGKEEIEEKKVKTPKVTEEPESEVRSMGSKQIISIKLPDVKSDDDIEIKKLEQSIEVKAFSGDKAYFKLLPVPSTAVITGKKFKDGVLKIEIEG